METVEPGLDRRRRVRPSLSVTAVYSHLPRSPSEALYLREHVSQGQDDGTEPQKHGAKSSQTWSAELLLPQVLV